MAFVNFANEARDRSHSASVALKYACKHWTMHISRTLNIWEDRLNNLFHTFLNRHLFAWLEMQWCLNSLRSCLTVIAEGQKLIKQTVFKPFGKHAQQLCGLLQPDKRPALVLELYHPLPSSKLSIDSNIHLSHPISIALLDPKLTTYFYSNRSSKPSALNFFFISSRISQTSRMSEEQSLEGTWTRLSQVAVKGAQYNSPERQPHPKCLEGTRVDLLKFIHGFLDDRKKNQLIWLHGTAGVGKSAVAFTVAERMKGLKVTEETNVEKRLAGTFFFSRKHTKRCTTGYFFVTLAYQLATNFPSIRQDVNRAIRNNPALLDPDAPLCDQMEALFLQPLRKLQLRLRGCPPLSFVVDALDECTSEPELADLILSLAHALRDPDIPAIHILLTSRSETHIFKAFHNEEVRPLLCEIPVKTSGEGVATIISLDGADVDKDIYTFLQHSFAELASRHTDFPQPSKDDLAKLASRAGRRFIVASTMMKFIIDDEDDDPRDRLQLMLKLTSELLPGTEVYKLYDCILSTCADPKRAYMHLSIVAALADPLPISQISSLLGPGLGRDVQRTLIQLRSVMDIPTDSTLPMNIYHSSVRDYVSDPLNCGLPEHGSLGCALRTQETEPSYAT
ncbi:hypothetical protein DFJ58DRAFT_727416 [Suillus subalutaceus]|uniref:uncharacterized protein n=1 Tax=Suillus subalutaceus TaxID=48586 RepID=UPI001B88577D|nr:uncharacterized protein DFJ58DRAFT_727416 [Suillus subalutaceus]KAG1855756.1 hypothetical protein DFJ58DRAFT_727416 [Suillus subalutaceus]